MFPSDIKKQCEHIWQTWGVICPWHKTGWCLNDDDRLKWFRGKRYTMKRKSKYQGYLRPYLTEKGIEYNHYQQLRAQRTWDTNKRSFSGD